MPIPSMRFLIAVAALLLATGRADAQHAVTLKNPKTLSTPKGYSHIAEVRAGSRMVFLSGQVPIDSAGNLVGAGDFRAQATQVFENLKAALASEGLTFRDLVKFTFYLRDSANLATLREVRDRYVDTSSPPASTLVVVQGLYRPDVMLEVEAIAAGGGQ